MGHIFPNIHIEQKIFPIAYIMSADYALTLRQQTPIQRGILLPNGCCLHEPIKYTKLKEQEWVDPDQK